MIKIQTLCLSDSGLTTSNMKEACKYLEEALNENFDLALEFLTNFLFSNNSQLEPRKFSIKLKEFAIKLNKINSFLLFLFNI